MAKTGTAYAVGAAGVLLVYSGLSNKGFLVNVRDIIAGNAPTPGPKQSFLSSLTGSSTASSSPSNGTSIPNSTDSGQSDSSAVRAQNKLLMQSMAAAYGWSSGDEWTALDAIVMQESGYDSYAANPTSSARGIAQNINGWSSNYQPGNAAQQIAWMLSYIKGRYGDPIVAEQFHLANNWY